MFDWHFTLRGPRDTEFEGGIYHGRIVLPSDYPFKPPNIMLLTVVSLSLGLYLLQTLNALTLLSVCIAA